MTSLKPFPYALNRGYELALRICDKEGLQDDDPVAFLSSWTVEDMIRLARDVAETRDAIMTPYQQRRARELLLSIAGIPLNAQPMKGGKT